MSENINSPVQSEEVEQDINILKKVRLDKLAELKNNNADPYTITKYDVTARASELKAKFEADEARIISEANGDEEKVQAGLEEIKAVDFRLAGRIMSWRNMGKANFIDIRDGSVRTISARKNLKNLKNGISVILSALKVLYSEPVWVKFQSMPTR